MIRLVLPWPPTVNHHYGIRTREAKMGQKSRSRGRRVFLQGKSRSFYKVVADCVVEQLRRIPRMSERLKVTYFCSPPDLRRRDLSNIIKATEDSLTRAGVWNDDCQIDEFTVCRELPKSGGQIVVMIEAISIETRPLS